MGTILKNQFTGRQMLTVVMVDVVGSSKGYAFDKSERTKQTWKLYERLCNHRKPLTFNTWGDGLVASFTDPIDAISFAKILFDETKLDDYDFLRFRISIHSDTTEVIKNHTTNRLDLIGKGIYIAARIEPVIKNGSTVVTEKVYDLIKNNENINIKSFTKPFLFKSSKDGLIIKARYFTECCTKDAINEIEQQDSEEQKANFMIWDELIQAITKGDTNITSTIDDTEEIIVYFINGGESGITLAEALRVRLNHLKSHNKLKLNKITLATLTVEGTEQDNMLKESGLLTNRRGTHREMVTETRRRFHDLVDTLDSGIKYETVDIPWPPLGAVLITDTHAYIRPCVYFEDTKRLPVICAGNSNDYYKKYSKALNEAIRRHKK